MLQQLDSLKRKLDSLKGKLDLIDQTRGRVFPPISKH